MTYIAINTIGEYPEDFLIAKVDVERKLLEDEVIEKRMKLEDFIIYLNIQKTIYMKGQKSIAFRIIEGQSDSYVFYSLLDPVNNNDLFESFKTKLDKLQYKFDSLKKIEPMEMLQMNMDESEIMMIDFVMYK
jgi:hypothetical protein